MQSETLNNFLPKMNQLTDEYLSKISVVEYNTFNQLNWDIAWSFIVGQRGEKFKAIAKEYYTNVRDGFRSFPINLPGTTLRKAINSRAALFKVFSELLTECEQIPDPSADNCLKAIRESAANFNTPIERPLFGLLFASFETTASNLNGLIWNIINNPTVLQKLIEEIKQYPPPETVNDFHKYTYLTKVIRESLRVTAGNLIFRENNTGLHYKNYNFPPQTTLLIITGYAHQEVKDFEKFDPDREDVYKWEPFGSAPRNCLIYKTVICAIVWIVSDMSSQILFKVKFDKERKRSFRKVNDAIDIKFGITFTLVVLDIVLIVLLIVADTNPTNTFIALNFTIWIATGVPLALIMFYVYNDLIDSKSTSENTTTPNSPSAQKESNSGL